MISLFGGGQREQPCIETCGAKTQGSPVRGLAFSRTAREQMHKPVISNALKRKGA